MVRAAFVNRIDSCTASTSAPERQLLQFALLTAAAAVAAYARFALSPLQEGVRNGLSLSDNQMAVLQGPALALPMVAASIPLGLLIDRYSRVRLLLIFAALDLGGSLLTAMSYSFTLLLLARCVVGLAVGAVSTTAFSLLADLFAPAARGRASMVVIIGQYVGMSGVFALGGFLLSVPKEDPNGWRRAMLWLSVPLGIIVLAMWAMREPVRTGLIIRNPSAKESFHELWHYRAVVLPLIVGLVMAEMDILAALTWAPPALSRDLDVSAGRVGGIMALGLIVSGVVGPIVGGFLTDHCQRTGGARRTRSMLGWLMIFSVPTGLFAVMPGLQLATALLITFLIVLAAILVAGITLFTVVIPNELRGLCMSILAGAQMLVGVALAPISVSILSTMLGGPAMLGRALACVCVTSGVVGAAAFMWDVFHRRVITGGIDKTAVS